MPKLELEGVTELRGASYPAPHAAACAGRRVRRLGEAAHLTRLGVSHVVLSPGARSSQRHWHAEEDEFVWILEGEVVLLTDAGEQPLRAGDCAAFKAGVRDGHCLENRADRDAVLLAMSNRNDDDWGEYSDIDMQFAPGRYAGRGRYLHKDGTPY